jgi:hypothetical protein
VARSALKPRRASLGKDTVRKTGILEMIREANGIEEIGVDCSSSSIFGTDSTNSRPDQTHLDRPRALNPSIQLSIQPSTQPLPQTPSPSVTTPLISQPAFPTDNTDIRVRSPVLRPSKHLPRHNHTPSPYNHNYTKMASTNKAAFPTRNVTSDTLNAPSTASISKAGIFIYVYIYYI